MRHPKCINRIFTLSSIALQFPSRVYFPWVISVAAKNLNRHGEGFGAVNE
jgi:hypothetical protein